MCVCVVTHLERCALADFMLVNGICRTSSSGSPRGCEMASFISAAISICSLMLSMVSSTLSMDLIKDKTRVRS